MSSEPCCRGPGGQPWSWRGHDHRDPLAQDGDCVSLASMCSHTQPPPARPCGPQAGSRPTGSAGGHTGPGRWGHLRDAGRPSSLRGPPPGSWALRGNCHLPCWPHGCDRHSDQQQLHLCLTSTEGAAGQRSTSAPLAPTATSACGPPTASISTPDKQHHPLQGLTSVATDSVSVPSTARTLQL